MTTQTPSAKIWTALPYCHGAGWRFEVTVTLADGREIMTVASQVNTYPVICLAERWANGRMVRRDSGAHVTAKALTLRACERFLDDQRTTINHA